MNARLRQHVRDRAGERCEYCRVRQQDALVTAFQVEHIIAIQHGGTDDESNLALACSHCNRHKGPNLTGIDPLTATIQPLFHPRLDAWTDHFEQISDMIVGLTACGRATVRVLGMNNDDRLELRASLRQLEE